MSSKTKTTATKEEEKPSLVPKLRFPEFRAAPGWQPKRLGLALRFQAGFPFPSSGFNDSGNGLRLIRNRDLRSDDIVVFYSGDFDPSFVVSNGDVLVGMDGDFTPSVWEKGEALLNQRVGRILPRGDNDHRFLLHLLTLSLKGIEQATARTTVKHLSHSAVEDKHEPLPPPAEQQKIAECLSSVDELMAAQARKVDALKTHKKGLMQQLFPREGETQPRLRFPEFPNAGEWSEGRLADVATVLQGYGFPERHQGHTSGDYPFYKVSDISRSFAAGKVFIQESANYVNEDLLKELRAKPIPGGATIFAKIGEAIRSNKRAITTIPCLIDNNAAGVKQIKGKATDLFIYLLMEQISLIDYAGGVVPAVNKSAIEEIAIKFPELDEQERIASCMSSLDALIMAETQRLESFKTHKNGLMQQLFPCPGGVDA